MLELQTYIDNNQELFIIIYMNKKENENKLFEILKKRSIDIDFVQKWYQTERKILVELGKQRDLIRHPRHRGDSREDVFVDFLKQHMPENFGISKGYAVNPIGMTSCELDCMIYSKESTFRLIKINELDYIPVELVLSAIEIKSNYTIQEMRKSVINCISLKSTLDNSKTNNFFYTIFAYDSPYTLDNIVSRLNELSKDIENKSSDSSVIKRLPIDMLYILNKGIIYRKKKDNDNSLSIYLESILTSNGEYSSIPIKEEGDFSFLLYIGVIIDFVIKENRDRIIPKFLDYAIMPEIIKCNIRQKKNKKL